MRKFFAAAQPERYVTGRSISSQQGEQPPAYPIVQIGLDCDNLADRIYHRTYQMLELGWESEVQHLITKYGWDLPNLNTLGYAEMRQYLAGEISLTAAIDLTILHTRQFAKRQRTWFRASPDIIWFDSSDRNLLGKMRKYHSDIFLTAQPLGFGMYGLS